MTVFRKRGAALKTILSATVAFILIGCVSKNSKSGSQGEPGFEPPDQAIVREDFTEISERSRFLSKEVPYLFHYAPTHYAAWQNRAAVGDANAQYLLARCRQSGIGGDLNFAEAAKLMRSAAQTLPLAQVAYANMLDTGMPDVPRDQAEALEYYTKAWKSGETLGGQYLAVMYIEGKGVTRDETYGMALLKEAVSRGQISAMVELAYYAGMKDPNLESKWLHAAADAGSTEAMIEIAQRLARAHDDTSLAAMVKLAQRAADLGDVRGMLVLVSAYFHGSGVQKNLDEARKWAFAAADTGDVSAINFLGECYFNGEIVVSDWSKAAQLYQEAARRGCTDAYCNIASMYLSGHGYPTDYGAAMHWARKAADAGNAKA